MIGLGQTPTAIRYLKGALEHDNPMVRLAAMETLVETRLLLPELEPAVAALVPADPKERPYDARMARYMLQLFENDAAIRGGSDK